MRRRTKNSFRIAFVTLVWAPIFVLAAGLAKGGAADFAGFDLGSKATGAQWTYDQPSLGIPAHPTGEFNVAHSEATLQSGPIAYGLGSSAWPGQVASALPTFVQGEFQNGCQCELPTTAPNYPVRAESFYPQGPQQASTDAGTMSMRSSARESQAEGSSHANAVGFPGVGGSGNQTSFVSNGFDLTGAVSMAEAAANDISMIGGLITIDSVVTRATARSDGERGTVAGGTTVTGATVQGIGVVVDEDGAHAGEDGDVGSAAAQQAVNMALSGAGVTMELAQPVDTVQGPKASRSLGGLLVRMKPQTVETLVSALPAELQKEIRDEVTFDQTVAVQFAPAVVSAVAAKNVPFGSVTPPGSGPTTSGGGGGSTPSGTTTTTDGSTPGDTGSAAPSDGGATVGGIDVAQLASAPATSSFPGVPPWLIGGFVLFALGTSRPLVWAADKILAAKATSAPCPLEGAQR